MIPVITLFRKGADLRQEIIWITGEDPLGKTIEIKQEPYIVVGIVAKSKEFEPVINSIEDYYTYAQVSSGKVYVPDSTWPIIYQFDEPQNLVIRVDSTDNMTTAGKESANILNGFLSTSDETIKYQAEDLLEQAKKIQELGESTNSMLIWIAGISLIVGGIGVMNIMLVEKSYWSQKIQYFRTVSDRSRCTDQYGRDTRRNIGNCAGGSHIQNQRNAGCH